MFYQSSYYCFSWLIAFLLHWTIYFPLDYYAPLLLVILLIFMYWHRKLAVSQHHQMALIYFLWFQRFFKTRLAGTIQVSHFHPFTTSTSTLYVNMNRYYLSIEKMSYQTPFTKKTNTLWITSLSDPPLKPLVRLQMKELAKATNMAIEIS